MLRVVKVLFSGGNDPFVPQTHCWPRKNKGIRILLPSPWRDLRCRWEWNCSPHPLWRVAVKLWGFSLSVHLLWCFSLSHLQFGLISSYVHSKYSFTFEKCCFVSAQKEKRICLHPGWLKVKTKASFESEEVLPAGELEELRGNKQIEREGGRQIRKLYWLINLLPQGNPPGFCSPLT